MKQWIHFVLLLLFWVAPVADALGQLPGYPVRKFTAEHGLRFNIVKVVQDTGGFIWMMYPDKVQRFDGKHNDTYFKDERLHSLHVDSRGEVWVTTRKGVFVFDAHSRRFMETASEIPPGSKKVVFEPEQGKLFCISPSGIYLYHEASKRFILSSVPAHQMKPGAGISFRKFSHAGQTLYYCAGDTIWRHTMQTGKTDNILFRELRSVVALSEKEMIVSTTVNYKNIFNLLIFS